MRIIMALLVTVYAWGLDEPHKYFQNFSGSGVFQSQDYFPLGVWLQPTFDIAKYKAAGINLYVTGESRLAYAAQCKAYGMPVIMDQSQEVVDRLSLFEDVIVGWGQMDEPDCAQPDGNGGYDPCIATSVIQARYDTIRAADATRPVFLNFGPGVANIGWYGRGTCTGNWQMYPAYCEGAEIVCHDIYPVNSSMSLWYVPKGVDSLRSWTNNAKPVWTYIECTDISSGGGGKPSVAQIKSEIWMSIVHGANGVLYFCHSFVDGGGGEDAILDDAVTLAGITGINNRITELAAVLNSPSVLGRVTCSAANVDILVKEYQGDLFVFAAEMTGASASPTFTVTDPPDNNLTVLDEGRDIVLSGNGFSDAFGAYGVHLYHIGENFSSIKDVHPVSVPDVSITRNPFSVSIEIMVRFIRGNAVTAMDIFTVGGERIASIPVVAGKAVWDGSMTDGTKVRAGMYLVGINGRITAKIMKMDN